MLDILVLAPLSENFFICQKMSTNLSHLEHFLFQTKKHPHILIVGKSSITSCIIHLSPRQNTCNIIGHLHSRERNTVRHLYPNRLLKNEHPIFLFLTTKTKKQSTFQRTMIRLDSYGRLSTLSTTTYSFSTLFDQNKFKGYHLYWTLGKSKFEPLLDYVHLSVLFVAEVQVVRCCAVSTTSPTYISFKSVIEGGNH